VSKYFIEMPVLNYFLNKHIKQGKAAGNVVDNGNGHE
jgi:hypothetical protein